MKRVAESMGSVVLLLAASLPVSILGQELTIPEKLAEAGKSLIAGTTVPSGPPPSVQEIIRGTDTLVRGIIGPGRAYLSEDQREIYTDYPIEKPLILFQSAPVSSARPGVMPRITVTVSGGTVTVGNLTFTSMVDALPTLQPGTECLLLLKRIGDRYQIAGAYYGAFGIEHGKSKPLTKKQGFAREYDGASAQATVDDVLAKLHARAR